MGYRVRELMVRVFVILCLVGVALILVLSVVSLASYYNLPVETETGIYDGYNAQGTAYYPRVIIDGELVTSLRAQKVPDSSHVGEEVTVTYRGDITQFYLTWE